MKVIAPVPLGSAFRSRPIGGPAGVSCNEGTRERENEGVAGVAGVAIGGSS